MRQYQWWISVIVGLVVGGGIGYYFGYNAEYDGAVSRLGSIQSFEDCAAAGYPIQESFPEVCRTPDGRSFTKQYE